MDPLALGLTSPTFLLHGMSAGIAVWAPSIQESSGGVHAVSLLLCLRWQSSKMENLWVSLGDAGLSVPSPIWHSVPWPNHKVILLPPHNPNSTTSPHQFGTSSPSISQFSNLQWQKTSNKLPRASPGFTFLSRESLCLVLAQGQKEVTFFPTLMLNHR